MFYNDCQVLPPLLPCLSGRQVLRRGDTGVWWCEEKQGLPAKNVNLFIETGKLFIEFSIFAY